VRGERPGETGRRIALRSLIVIVLELVLVLGFLIIDAQERLLRDNRKRSLAIRQTERTITRKNRGRPRGRLRLSCKTGIKGQVKYRGSRPQTLLFPSLVSLARLHEPSSRDGQANRLDGLQRFKEAETLP